MDQIKVSVCMVTYNHERFIAQAVQSALAQQTTFPLEIVIGEDYSTDNTRNVVIELAQQHPDVIRLRLAAHNQGAKANFIGTLAACRGHYVAMLEGDDYWTCPNKLQRQIEALDAHPHWAMCFHPTTCIYEADLRGQDVYPLEWTKPEATLVDLLAANFIPTNSVVFRNRLFPEFPAWFHELKLGDWPLHILNATYGNIGFLPEVMAAYRIHRGGIWNSETPAARMAAIFRMLSVVDHHFAGKYARVIDQYRLNAIAALHDQVDTANRRFDVCEQQLREIRATPAGQQHAVVSDFLLLQNSWNQLSHSYAALLRKRDLLAAQNCELQTFRDRWSKTYAYRINREIRRVVNQLRHLSLRPNAAAPATPENPANSRAA